MFAVGFLIAVVRIAHWCITKGGGKGMNWRLLVPFAGSAVSFALAGACVGGLVGTLVAWARNLFGGIGDTVLEKGTGARAVSVSHPAQFGTLNPFGALIMLAFIAVLVVLWRSGTKLLKKEVSWGGVCGINLGPFLGAVTLVPLVNQLGTAAIGRWF
jgi:hypothetical protein